MSVCKPLQAIKKRNAFFKLFLFKRIFKATTKSLYKADIARNLSKNEPPKVLKSKSTPSSTMWFTKGFKEKARCFIVMVRARLKQRCLFVQLSCCDLLNFEDKKPKIFVISTHEARKWRTCSASIDVFSRRKYHICSQMRINEGQVQKYLGTGRWAEWKFYNLDVRRLCYSYFIQLIPSLSQILNCDLWFLKAGNAH